MQIVQAILGSATALAIATYLVVVDYAGAEPIALLTVRDSWLFIAAPAALVALWLVLAVAAIVTWRARMIQGWLCAVLVALSLGAGWVATWPTTGYIDALTREPRSPCECAR